MSQVQPIKNRVLPIIESKWEFVLDYNKGPLSPEVFSDKLARDLGRLSNCRKELDWYRTSFDQKRCSTLPELVQIAEQCEALDLTLRERAVDFEVLGQEVRGHDEWVNTVWDQLQPHAIRLNEALANYADAILRHNLADRLIGRKQTHGQCAHASWVEFPGDERSLRKHRIRRDFFRHHASSDPTVAAKRLYPEQKATYFPKKLDQASIFSTYGFAKKPMAAKISQLPAILKPLARLEFGHRADGVGEQVLIYRVGDFVLGGQRLPVKAPPVPRCPPPPKQHRSLWRAFRGAL